MFASLPLALASGPLRADAGPQLLAALPPGDSCPQSGCQRGAGLAPSPSCWSCSRLDFDLAGRAGRPRKHQQGCFLKLHPRPLSGPWGWRLRATGMFWQNCRRFLTDSW